MLNNILLHKLPVFVNSGLPVMAGLAVGIAFIIVFAVFTTQSIPNVQLDDRWDKEGQQKAVSVLLSDMDVRRFVLGKEFEVWAFSPNYPSGSVITPGFSCGESKNMCTLIGIRKLNADGSVDCPLKAIVNIESRTIDVVNYGGPCDQAH